MINIKQLGCGWKVQLAHCASVWVSYRKPAWERWAGKALTRPHKYIICINHAGPDFSSINRIQLSLAKNERSECIQRREEWENRETPAQRETMFPNGKKKKTPKLVFLHGFFLFQHKKDSLARVEKWSPDSPEQLILVVHMVIGALVSVRPFHAWGLRLKVAFSVLRFSIHLCY